MKFREATLILKNKGYILDRVKGSHYIFIKNGIEIVIPQHTKDLPSYIIRLVKRAL